MPTKRRLARLAELAGLGHGRGSDQLVRTGIPPSADLTPEHHVLLGAAVQFRVRSFLSALGVLRDNRRGVASVMLVPALKYSSGVVLAVSSVDATVTLAGCCRLTVVALPPSRLFPLAVCASRHP